MEKLLVIGDGAQRPSAAPSRNSNVNWKHCHSTPQPATEEAMIAHQR